LSACLIAVPTRRVEGRLAGPATATEALQDGLRVRKVTVAELTRVVEVLPSRA